MTARYRDLMFTPPVRQAQTVLNGRELSSGGEGAGLPDLLGPDEAGFLSRRDSFYMATTSATGWPYLQHRGGPPGFVRPLSQNEFGFADFRGNRQYISVGNLATDDRAAFFFMDYANRARLKLMGRIRIITDMEDAERVEALTIPGYPGRVERAFLVTVEAFEWNCPQHIEPRYTMDELAPALDHLKARISDLEGQLAAVRQS